jgi:CheY-like chemotaxis protein/HPt (histidine-containing phosphotransfer) domain-containing protein
LLLHRRAYDTILVLRDPAMRILVADDDPTNRELLTELLLSGGHSVTTVLDGSEVLATLAREQFEVVLMDEEMPRMSGLEAARAIVAAAKQGERRPIIVGISGNATKEDEARCLAAGMDAFFPKPVRAAELFSVLAVLARRVPAGPPAVAPEPVELTVEHLTAHLDSATGGNQKLARSLVKTFLEDAPKRMAVLRRAVAEKDAGGLAAAAHALKGSLSLIGAPKAAGTARNLQAMGRLGTLDGASAELTVLESEFQELQKQLAALPGNSESPKRSGPRNRNKK